LGGGGWGSSILNAYFVLHCFVADSDASDDGEESSSASKFLQIVLENSFTNLVPRPFTPPVLITYSMQKQRGRPGESCHVIRGGIADVTDSRCNDLFTFLFIATEKLEN